MRSEHELRAPELHGTIRGMRKIVALAGCLISVAGCSVGIKRVFTTRTRTVTVTAEAAAQPSRSGRCASLGAIGQVYKIGQPFRNGNFKVAVTKVSEGPTLPHADDPDTPGPRTSNGKYIILFLTVTNVGFHPAEFDGNSTLYDTCGRQYKESDDDGLASVYRVYRDPLKYPADIQTGSTMRGVIAFDVPRSVKRSIVFIQAQSGLTHNGGSTPTPVDISGG